MIGTHGRDFVATVILSGTVIKICVIVDNSQLISTDLGSTQ